MASTGHVRAVLASCITLSIAGCKHPHIGTHEQKHDEKRRTEKSGRRANERERADYRWRGEERKRYIRKYTDTCTQREEKENAKLRDTGAANN